MDNKMSLSERIVEFISLLIIIIAIIVKYYFSKSDIGIIVILGFVAILLFCILKVANSFPATWRMTEKEKEKIQDIDKYQEKYRRVFVGINLVVCIAMASIILFLIP